MQGIVFDLDDTLCDYQAAKVSASKPINALLVKRNIDAAEFWEHYNKIEQTLFNRYMRKEISRDEYRFLRFAKVLTGKTSEVTEMVSELNHLYTTQVHHSIGLFQDAIFLLRFLREKTTLRLAILTNGSSKGQRKKLRTTGLDNYIANIFISEEIGYAKPDPEAFLHVLNRMYIKPCNALMVGDSYHDDYLGAKSVGMKTLLVDRKQHERQSEVKTISNLTEVISVVLDHKQQGF